MKKNQNNGIVRLNVNERFNDAAKWRWEFMRRTDDYKKAYKRLIDMIEKSKYKPDDIETIKTDTGCIIELSLFQETKAYRFLKRCCIKYNMPVSIKPIPDPSKSFEDIKNRIIPVNSLVDLFESIKDPVRSGFKKMSKVQSFACNIQDNDLQRIFYIDIDFERINSIDAVKKNVSLMIDSAFADYKKRKTVRREKDYELILKIGDLKNSGLKHPEIAAQLFPKEYKTDPVNTTKTMSNRYCDYKELINGGYKSICFP